MLQNITRIIQNLIIICALLASSFPTSAHADSTNTTTSPHIVIGSIQAGDSASARNEVIEIWNMSDAPVDITGWAIGYFSSTATLASTSAQLVKFSSEDLATHLMLEPNSRETIVSKDYASAYGIDASAFQFASTLTYDKSAIELVDANGATVDLVGWGTNARYEGSPANIMTATTNIIRPSEDTNNNAADFDLAQQQSLQYTYGHIFEIVDVCLNIPDIQELVPDGMVASNGNCSVPDVCPNIDGPQAIIPEGDELRGGKCLPIFIAQPLQITELLPNPAGADGGR